MVARDLRLIGDSVLGRICAPITDYGSELGTLVSDMFDTMYAAAGRGLAAPQIGLTSRVFVTDTTWKDGTRSPMAFVNPTITAAATEMLSGPEACLSIPDRSFTVARPAWVDAAWQDPDGAPMSARFDGIDVICFCHELDHLDGVLITQSGTET